MLDQRLDHPRDPGGLVRPHPLLREADAAAGRRDRDRRGRRVVRAVVRRRGPVDRPGRRRDRPGRAGLRALAAAASSRPRAGTGRGGGRSRSSSTITWWQNGGVEVRRRHPDRRPRRDDAVRRHARSRCSCTSTRPRTCAATVRYTYFYAVLSLFTASMLLLVVADNTLADARRLGARRPLLVHADRALVGGEAEHRRRAQGVPHHPHRRHRPDDRRHHHVLRRRADVQHRRDQRVRARARGADHDLLLVGAICLLIGIIGKSGQFPLHTWLPDAMAGPDARCRR